MVVWGGGGGVGSGFFFFVFYSYYAIDTFFMYIIFISAQLWELSFENGAEPDSQRRHYVYTHGETHIWFLLTQ